MKIVILAAVLSLATISAWAQAPTCSSQTVDKNLAGAAKTSFLKKCQADATTACTSAATDKHLAGAAKSSFMKKCVSDAVG
jgi:hypothetical protein